MIGMDFVSFVILLVISLAGLRSSTLSSPTG